MSAGERIALTLFRLMERAAMAVPERFGRWLWDLVARVAHRLMPETRSRVEGNLSRVLGRPTSSEAVRAAARDSFRSYSRFWFDAFHIRSMPAEEFMKRMRHDGHEHVLAGLEAGRGVVVALPHLGNYDVAGHWQALEGHRLVAVAEELRPKELTDLFVHHREALGMEIVTLSDTRKLGEQLVRLLAANSVVALVADRDLKGTGVEVEMFGATRRLPAGPALLSLGTGAPLLPTAMYDTDEGWLCRFGEPLRLEPTGDTRADVTELTRRLAEEFERAIAASPTQWHVFEDAWA